MAAEDDTDPLLGEIGDEQEGDDDLAPIFLEELLGLGEETDSAAPRASREDAGKSRIGNSIYVGNKLMGTISYLLHWKPASFSAKCKIHENCVCTAHYERVDEGAMEKWLLDGGQYRTADAHLLAKPEGAYNKPSAMPSIRP